MKSLSVFEIFLLMHNLVYISLFHIRAIKRKGILSLHVLIQHKYFEVTRVDKEKCSCFCLPFCITFCHQLLHLAIVKHDA